MTDNNKIEFPEGMELKNVSPNDSVIFTDHKANRYTVSFAPTGGIIVKALDESLTVVRQNLSIYQIAI